MPCTKPTLSSKAALARLATLACLAALVPIWAFAHGVGGSDGDFLASNTGHALGAYFYLGAKHMVTGYDHLLFLAGVVFFLYQWRDVVLYVSLFALGHSASLLLGVLANLQLNVYLVDAVIGLSVVFKALDNLGFFKNFGWQPNLRWAVLLFGGCHGFGLATKLQELGLRSDGLLGNMLAFNLGVEAGQLLALTFILLALSLARRSTHFAHFAVSANWLILVAGLLLVGYQLTGYWLEAA